MAHTGHNHMGGIEPTFTPSTEDTVAELTDRIQALEAYLEVFYCEECGEYGSLNEQNPNPTLLDSLNPNGPNYEPPLPL